MRNLRNHNEPCFSTLLAFDSILLIGNAVVEGVNSLDIKVNFLVIIKALKNSNIYLNINWKINSLTF